MNYTKQSVGQLGVRSARYSTLHLRDTESRDRNLVTKIYWLLLVTSEIVTIDVYGALAGARITCQKALQKKTLWINLAARNIKITIISNAWHLSLKCNCHL